MADKLQVNQQGSLQGFLTEAHCAQSIPIHTRPLADVYMVESRPFARGKFATVRRCRHKTTGLNYAAKFIRKRRRANDVRHEILHEVYVLKLSDSCSRIIHLHEVYETTSELILVLEMATGGELQRMLDEEETVTEKDAIRLMRQILEGVIFLHDRNIAHLDLKPQNLLLMGTFPKCSVKLCDFGISRVIAKGIEIREIVGTPDYVAPEVLHYEPISMATDMWSIGVLAYVLLSGHTPFGGDSKQETFFNITDGAIDFPDELFGNVSNQGKDFIQRLLVRDPSDRMTGRESLQHPWLQQGTNGVNKASSQLSPFITSGCHISHLNQNGNEDVKGHVSDQSKPPARPDETKQIENKENLPKNEKTPKGPSDGTSSLCNGETGPKKPRQADCNNSETKAPAPSLVVSRNEISVVPVEVVEEESTGHRVLPLLGSTCHRGCARPAEVPAERGPCRKIRPSREPKCRADTHHVRARRHVRHASAEYQQSQVSSSIERQSIKAGAKMEDMVVELEGLALTKRLIFSEDIMVDERVGMVY